MFPVQISVFISKVQVHLDHHEINVSKYNTSVEMRRGESSEPWWKPELLQALLGIKAGPAARPHPDGAVRPKDLIPSFSRACAPPWWAPLHSVPDRFAFCCRRESESFHGQTPHFPLLPQLHLTIILNLFKHQPHKLALKVSELPCVVFSTAQSPTCLHGWCWDLTTTTGHHHTLHKLMYHPSMQKGPPFRRGTTER